MPVSSSRLRKVVPLAVGHDPANQHAGARFDRGQAVGGHNPERVEPLAQELDRVAEGRQPGRPQIGGAELDRAHAGKLRRLRADHRSGQPIRARLRHRPGRPERLPALQSEAAERSRRRQRLDLRLAAPDPSSPAAPCVPEPDPAAPSAVATPSLSGSRVAVAALAWRSGPRTTTPWRRAPPPSVSAESPPGGCDYGSGRRKPAGKGGFTSARE